MDTMQQLPQNEHYEAENRSCAKCCLQELTHVTCDYHKSTQDGSLTRQSTEEIFMESHCNELELELAALTMLFKSLGKDGAFDSKGVRLCGVEIGGDSFDIVANLDKDDYALLEVHLEELLSTTSEHSKEAETHTLVSRVHTGPQQDLIRKTVERQSGSLRKLDAILFQDNEDKLTNK
jgi:hypothetical protein